MRPVNLIPRDQQRAREGGRTGPLAYLVVGGLVLLLAGVVALVLSSNQISERESELTTLNARKAAAETRSARLEPYTSFENVARERTTTITELADSRFDWPRVLRQMSLIIPRYVLLTKLTGVAGQGLGEGGGDAEASGSDLAAQIKGPSLSMEGCAANQKRVAALVNALHHIDGVTRVGLKSSAKEDEQSGGGGGDSESSSRCGSALYKFNLAVAFDAAPASPDSVAGEAVAAPASEESSESSEDSTTTETNADGSETVSKTTTVTPPE